MDYSAAVEGKNFDHEKRDWDAEYGGYERTDDERNAKQIVSDEDNGVLDEVVGDIRNSELQTASDAHDFVKYEGAVETIGNYIAGDVGAVEGEVAWQGKGVNPG